MMPNPCSLEVYVIKFGGDIGEYWKRVMQWFSEEQGNNSSEDQNLREEGALPPNLKGVIPSLKRHFLSVY